MVHKMDEQFNNLQAGQTAYNLVSFEDRRRKGIWAHNYLTKGRKAQIPLSCLNRDTCKYLCRVGEFAWNHKDITLVYNTEPKLNGPSADFDSLIVSGGFILTNFTVHVTVIDCWSLAGEHMPTSPLAIYTLQLNKYTDSLHVSSLWQT